jgi:ornithine carbamoyltransferase
MGRDRDLGAAIEADGYGPHVLGSHKRQVYGEEHEAPGLKGERRFDPQPDRTEHARRPVRVGIQLPVLAGVRLRKGHRNLRAHHHHDRQARALEGSAKALVERFAIEAQERLGRADAPSAARRQQYAEDHRRGRRLALYWRGTRPMKPKHLISLKDYSREDIDEIFALAEKMKADPGLFKQALHGKTLAMIFQKPSTRTRVSFEMGMFQLGGLAVVLNHDEIQLSVGESVADTARVLSTFADGIMARVFAHQDVLDLAKFGSKPVINGLSDLLHPCQALADFFTLRERFGSLSGLKLAYVGDGNNVCHELMIGAARLGVEIVIATPKGFEPNPLITKSTARDAQKTGTPPAKIVNDPVAAVAGARAVYTDVWTSMGQEKDAEKRKAAFAGFTVNPALMAKAAGDAVFMHCLPAHRGLEVTDEVMDGPQSVVFQQAGNRLHAQKAAMVLLMGA